MRTLLFLIALTVAGWAQHPYTNPFTFVPFQSGSDTLGGLTKVDTVEWQLRHTALNWPAAWNTLATEITAANKTGEQTVVFDLSAETNWTWAEELRVRIRGPDGTITGGAVNIATRLGNITLFVQPDTITATTPDTTVYKVRIAGQ